MASKETCLKPRTVTRWSTAPPTSKTVITSCQNVRAPYIYIDFDLPLLVVGGPSLVDVRSFPSATSSESDLNETFQKAVVERDINCIMTDIKANDDVRRDPCNC